MPLPKILSVTFFSTNFATFRFLSAVPIPFHTVPSLVRFRCYLSKIFYITSAVATSSPGSSRFLVWRQKERRPSFLPPPYCRKTRKPWEGVLLSIYFLRNQMKFFYHFLAFLNITLYLSLSSAAISQVIKTRANIILRS